MQIAQADVVGSLLRPGWLLAARQRWQDGELDQAAFKAIEDRAVDTAVAQQEAVGLPVVTDGEIRRLSFQGHDRLAVSTQCGFGSSVLGNALTSDEQAAKLRLVVEIAERVWG